MKRITEYKKQFGITQDINLKEIKSTYRSFMKEWHPDKFAGDEQKLEEAEAKSKQFIEAYHFLVSIAPETRESQLEEYTKNTSSGIEDFMYKKQVLEITFVDGSTYEYFGVQKNMYIKMCNSATLNRFAKRHVLTSYIYRKSKKQNAEE